MADEVAAIYTSNNVLFALGALAIGSQDLKEDEENSGHAAFILHFKGDNLYLMGD